MAKNTFPVYRDTKSGRLITEKKAEKLPPERTVKESMPKKGHGDTGRK